MTFELKTTVLPGHRIELEVPGIPEGSTATLVLTIDDAPPPKRRLPEVMAGYPGRQLFPSAEEVDAYLRAERESWEQ